MSIMVNYLDVDSGVCENFFDALELSWHVWAISWSSLVLFK